MRTGFWGMISVMSLLAGCSQASGDAAPAAQAATSEGASTKPARDDACGLLSLGDIRRVLPEAARSERNDNLASQGIKACSWYGSGKAPVLDVSVWDSTGADDTPMENVRTLAMGVADPTRPGAEAALRFEVIPMVGEGGVALVEKSDPARGILTTAALLSFSKNGRIVTLASSPVANRERPRAIEDLTTLGKAIAARL